MILTLAIMIQKVNFENYDQFNKDLNILDEIEHKKSIKALDKLRRELEDKKIIKRKINEKI